MEMEFWRRTYSTSKNPARIYSIELKSVILVHNKNWCNKG